MAIYLKNKDLIGKAKYRCMECHHQWKEDPGWQEECSKCHAIYIEWLNYDELFPTRKLK